MPHHKKTHINKIKKQMKIIEAQHAFIKSKIITIEQALVSLKHPHDTIAELIALLDHVSDHLFTEEHLMRWISYDNIRDHEAAHDSLRNEFRYRKAVGISRHVDHILLYTDQWLRTHDREHDSHLLIAIKQYLRELEN